MFLLVCPAPLLQISNYLLWLLCVLSPQQEVQKIFKANHSMDIDVTKAKVTNQLLKGNGSA